MKLKFIFVLSLLLFCLPINAQEGWFLQSGGMSELLGVSFIDANNGTVVGAVGTIFRTTDGELAGPNKQAEQQKLY